MRVVGLTGGIGSGKSVVAARLASRGATVIDADRLAREAVAAGSPGLAQVVERFGSEFLDERGGLDRRKLGRLVFEDEAARRALNAIVHPRVAALAADRIREAAEAGAPLVVYDVPLLYENALERGLPAVIVVSAPVAVRRARIAARDGLPPEEIEARMAAQLPLADKVVRADHVIHNDGTLEATYAQVDRLFALLVGVEP